MGEKTTRLALRLAPLSSRDAAAAAELFRETVHAVNARDYTSEQLDAWAPGGAVPAHRLAELLLRQGALGAWDGSALVGLGSLEGADLLDMLFVHRDHQGRGVARLLAGGARARCAGPGRTCGPDLRVHHGASVFRAPGLRRAARECRRPRGHATYELPHGEGPAPRAIARPDASLATRSACPPRGSARRRPRSREARPWRWTGRPRAQARARGSAPPPRRPTSGPRGR